MQTAIACSVAPDYFPDELGYNNVYIDNIVEDADRVLGGTLIQNDTNSSPILRVSHSFKPPKRVWFRKSENITFRKVKKFHSISGSDDKAFRSKDKLKEYLAIYSIQNHSSDPLNYVRGYGGPLAGIGHGSDCKRMAFYYSDQYYLTFLDKDNQVMGLIPIAKKDIGDLNSLLFELEEIL